MTCARASPTHHGRRPALGQGINGLRTDTDHNSPWTRIATLQGCTNAVCASAAARVGTMCSPPSPHADVVHKLYLEAGRQPASPTYMAYIYQNPEPVGPRAGRPRPPISNTPYAASLLDGTRGVYEHFHAPCNDHNKFLSVAGDADRAAYRDLPRMRPPPFDTSGRSSIRPQSAGALGSGRSRRLGGASCNGISNSPSATMADKHVTVTGAPCYPEAIKLLVDLQRAAPVQQQKEVSSLVESGQGWRVAKVQAYEVAPTSMGYGEGGNRPFHQDYRHYKYYGFGGCGAKTSWAHNPKLQETWRQTRPSSAPTGRIFGARAIEAAAAAVRVVGTGLNQAQAKLVQQFEKHAYSAEKCNTEVIEPYLEHASLVTRQPLDRQEMMDRVRADKVKVATYRQPVSSSLTLEENPSPNHGSQSPFHQRYSHYRLHGFAGKGATSSWARNPKCAVLYD